MIIQYLQEELQNKDPNKSEKSMNTIKNIIEYLRNNSPSRIIIEKNRKQFNAIFEKYSGGWKFDKKSASPLPDSILIEYTNIDIDQSKSQKPKSLLTICMEGKNIEYVKKFKEDFINVDKGRTMGYPELIMSL
jgi:endo-alpha-1,4-polygalactosaminidase (GH114 family)